MASTRHRTVEQAGKYSAYGAIAGLNKNASSMAIPGGAQVTFFRLRAAAVVERRKLQGKLDLAKAKVLKRTPKV
jgi:hypothetical protein